MKKNLFLTLPAILCATCLLSAPAFCDDNIFGELSSTPPNAAEIQPTVKVEQPITVRGTTQMAKQETLTTQSLQNTVSSLEAAQADLSEMAYTIAELNIVDQLFFQCLFYSLQGWIHKGHF